jgi:hypothetical protein
VAASISVLGVGLLDDTSFWESVGGEPEVLGEELAEAVGVVRSWCAGRVAGCRALRLRRWTSRDGAEVFEAVATEARRLCASATGASRRDALLALALELGALDREVRHVA